MLSWSALKLKEVIPVITNKLFQIIPLENGKHYFENKKKILIKKNKKKKQKNKETYLLIV